MIHTIYTWGQIQNNLVTDLSILFNFSKKSTPTYRNDIFQPQKAVKGQLKPGREEGSHICAIYI